MTPDDHSEYVFLLTAFISTVFELHALYHMHKVQKEAKEKKLFFLHSDIMIIGYSLIISDLIIWMPQILINLWLLFFEGIFYLHDINVCYFLRIPFNMVFIFNDLMIVSTIYYQLKQIIEDFIIKIRWPKYCLLILGFLSIFICVFIPLMYVFDKSLDEKGNCYLFSFSTNRVYIIVVMVFILITFLFNIFLMIRAYFTINLQINDTQTFKCMKCFFGYQFLVYFLVCLRVFSQIDNAIFHYIIHFLFPLKGLANAKYFVSLFPSNKLGENTLQLVSQEFN